MNDKKFTQKNKKKSFIKENGFLIGLYSIVGVLVVAAIGVTFYGTGKSPAKGDNLVSMESKAVGNSMDESFTSKNDFSQIGNALTETAKEEGTNSESAEVTEVNNASEAKNLKPKAEDLPTQNEESSKPTEPATNENNSTSTPDVKINYETEPSIRTSEEMEININTDVVETAPIYEDDVTAVISQPVLTYALDSNVSVEDEENESMYIPVMEPENELFFADESLMKWPTTGNILMNFSIDKMVYDKTLDQFRTNDSVYISANVGDEVVAAADGVVLSTGKNIENGTYITISHGNGWKTVYSQLNDEIKVTKGERVSEGQLLGLVADPTNYSVNHGSHLNFKVVKNETPVNPLTVLAE